MSATTGYVCFNGRGQSFRGTTDIKAEDRRTRHLILSDRYTPSTLSKPSYHLRRLFGPHICTIRADAMASHATKKKRKLSHGGDGFGASLSASDGSSAIEDPEHSGTDASMSDGALSENEHEDAMDDDNTDEQEETGDDEEDSSSADVEAEAGKQSRARPAHKPSAARIKSAQLPEDGVYTAEVYKSHMFKLQVDDLLHQVKLRHGKSEAWAEAMLRKLRDIIEHVPSHAPLSASTSSSESGLRTNAGSSDRGSRKSHGSQTRQDTLSRSTAFSTRQLQDALRTAREHHGRGQLFSWNRSSGTSRMGY